VIKFLMGLFKAKPGVEIRKARDRKYKEAVQLQRNGKLREYAVLMKEIEALEDEYIRVIDESR
jgi:type IV secretory pathway protease TraF